MVSCIDGVYEPAKPSSFVCQPAAALVFSQSGEVEVVSEKCSMALTHFRDFAGRGRTASLLDKQILLLGNNTLSGSEGGRLGWLVNSIDTRYHRGSMGDVARFTVQLAL